MLQKHGDAMGKLSPKISVTITDHFSGRVEQSVSCARVCVCLRTDNNLNSVISLDPVWVRFTNYGRTLANVKGRKRKSSGFAGNTSGIDERR